MKETESALHQSIKSLDFRIRKLKKEESKSDTTSSLYNKLLIERAILREKLNKNKTNKFVEFFKKRIRKTRKQTLICDYF